MAITRPDELIIDSWSPLSHKAAVGDRNTAVGALLAPTWVPASERRRLAAYRVLAAYQANVARIMLSRATTEQQANHREYGDPELIVTRIRSGVLGDSTEFVVDGADATLPDEPVLPDPPGDLPAEASEAQRRVHAARTARYAADVADIVDEWIRLFEAQPALQARQAELRAWADRTGLLGRLVEGETDTVGLGDGVLVLWPQQGDWPTVAVYEPDGYFPVLADDNRDFPTKVHLAWGLEQTRPDGGTEQLVRRLTWELVPIVGERLVDDGTGSYVYGELAVGEEIDPETGMVYRVHPWQRDPTGQALVDDVPDLIADPTGGTSNQVPRRSDQTCVFTDATWRWDALGDRKVDDLDLDKAQTTYLRHDLGIDFLPVIHVPNTPASKAHFGQSALATAAQLLDDVARIDTDVITASDLTAVPMIAATGVQLPADQQVQPGAYVNLGDKGRLDVVDASNGVTVLATLAAGLRELLAVNTKVPAALVGRVDASSAASGVSMLLSFGPFTQLIGTLRMTREPKYRLLLKMAQRMAQVAGALPSGETPEARVEFGSFLPMDRAAVVDEVTKLLTVKALSLHTAVACLVAAGFPVEDARAEVERILREDTAGAVQVADATGSVQLAADRLGLELPVATVPTVTVTPAGGA